MQMWRTWVGVLIQDGRNTGEPDARARIERKEPDRGRARRVQRDAKGRAIGSDQGVKCVRLPPALTTSELSSASGQVRRRARRA